MELTWQSIITAGGVLSALLLLLTTYNRVYRWTLRQKEQDEELKAIRKARTLAEYQAAAQRLLGDCPLRENAVIET